jgi:Mg/Co/Ni transporter MgtE
VTSTLQVVESKDVLKFCLVVYDGSRALVFSLFQEVNKELLDVVRLLIADNGCEILEELQYLVLSEILISLSEKLVIAILDLQGVAHI